MLSPWKIKRLAALPQLLRNRIRGPEDLKRFPGLASAKLVTLDVFDTALLRSVAQPLDVLALAAWRAEKRHALGFGMQTLLEARRAAESAARLLARANGREEVTLDEVYAALPAPFAAAAPALQAEELATERDICTANPAILAVYNHLVASGIPVAFLSDTYFSQAFLETLLLESGYDGPHRVFASSSFGTSKSHGALFALVAAQLAIEPAAIWHIGDNAQSDVLQARRSGLHALWYRPQLRRPSHQNQISYARDERALATSLLAGIPHSLQEPSAAAPPWKQIGLSVAGPLYLAFTQWLLQKSCEVAPQHVYFCARDGQIIQKVYERLRSCYPLAPQSSYLMVSRRALLIPSLDHVSDKTANILVGGDHMAWLPVEEYLTRIRLDPANFTDEMSQHGVPSGTIIDGEAKRAKLRRLLQHLEPEIVRIAGQERLLLARYLAQEGCFETKHFAMCDIGWRGSLQRPLTSLVKETQPGTQITGYYFGTYGSERGADFGGPAHGWLIDADIPENRRRILQSGSAILDFLFTAQHGTVLNYAEEQETVVPTLAPVGITRNYGDAAGNIQRAALQFINQYVKAFSGLQPPPLDRNDVFPQLARLIDQPTLAEAKSVGDLVLADGLGTFNFGQPIAKPPALRQILIRPTCILDKFRQAPWRLGLLVRLIGSPKLACAAMALRRRLELKPKSA
jgi:FMN phosphatase YigB (HAD superfamily)